MESRFSPIQATRQRAVNYGEHMQALQAKAGALEMYSGRVGHVFSSV